MKLILFSTCALLAVWLQPIHASNDTLADELEKLAERGPLLVDNYIPVTMQILHHCIEMIQYEPLLTTPQGGPEEKPTTTTRRPTTTASSMAPTTTSSPVTTAMSSSTKPPEDSPVVTTQPTADTTSMHPTSPHKPGYFGPAKPPPTVVTTTVRTTTASAVTESTEPPKTTETSTTESLLWSDKPFAEWFLQGKRKKAQHSAPLNVQLLDPLPAKVLQDFNREPYEPLALRPEDNANEFRRLYDDQYRGAVAIVVLEKGTKKGGKKRVPPTKPYLHMLVLYDLLKREAKKFMYNVYEGYSEAIIDELMQMNFSTAREQLRYSLTQLLERKDIEKSDVVSRTKQMIADLDTRNSVLTMVLEVVPPLRFGL